MCLCSQCLLATRTSLRPEQHSNQFICYIPIARRNECIYPISHTIVFCIIWSAATAYWKQYPWLRQTVVFFGYNRSRGLVHHQTRKCYSRDYLSPDGMLPWYLLFQYDSHCANVSFGPSCCCATSIVGTYGKLQAFSKFYSTHHSSISALTTLISNCNNPKSIRKNHLGISTKFLDYCGNSQGILLWNCHPHSPGSIVCCSNHRWGLKTSVPKPFRRQWLWQQFLATKFSLTPSILQNPWSNSPIGTRKAICDQTPASISDRVLRPWPNHV